MKSEKFKEIIRYLIAIGYSLIGVLFVYFFGISDIIIWAIMIYVVFGALFLPYLTDKIFPQKTENEKKS